MAREMSAEEVLAECIRDMGRELGSEYNALRSEVVWLHAKWNLYRQLYARSAARVELLNRAAGHFFRVLQNMLVEDIVLHISRLLEKDQFSSDRRKLTLTGVPRLIANDALKADVQHLVRDARARALRFVKPWRDRRIAHRDRDLALALPEGEVLPRITPEDIEGALAAIRAVMNRLTLHYWASETRYQDAPIGSGRDADALVCYLRRGLGGEAESLQRIREGRSLPEDLHHGEEDV